MRKLSADKVEALRIIASRGNATKEDIKDVSRYNLDWLRDHGYIYSNDPYGGNITYSVSSYGYAQMMRATQRKEKNMALPRTWVKPGLYKGERGLPRRPGCEELDSAPSLIGNVRHYKDGRKELVTE